MIQLFVPETFNFYQNGIGDGYGAGGGFRYTHSGKISSGERYGLWYGNYFYDFAQKPFLLSEEQCFIASFRGTTRARRYSDVASTPMGTDLTINLSTQESDTSVTRLIIKL